MATTTGLLTPGCAGHVDDLPNDAAVDGRVGTWPHPDNGVQHTSDSTVPGGPPRPPGKDAQVGGTTLTGDCARLNAKTATEVSLSLSQYQDTAKATYYKITYRSDGLKINGYFAEPKGGGKFPAIIYNRGGNSVGGILTGGELGPFAEAGYVAIASQYRQAGGSEGKDEFGGADVHDVVSLVGFLRGRSSVDRSRIYMYGGSRGGMMTYLSLKFQQQCKVKYIRAAATAAGVTDLVMWAQHRPDLDSPGGFYSQTVGTTISQNPIPFQDRSATYWPNKITVPLWVGHGDADTDVPVNQAQTLASKMQAAGRVVQLKIFPGDTHGLPQNGGGVSDALAWFSGH